MRTREADRARACCHTLLKIEKGGNAHAGLELVAAAVHELRNVRIDSGRAWSKVARVVARELI